MHVLSRALSEDETRKPFLHLVVFWLVDCHSCHNGNAVGEWIRIRASVRRLWSCDECNSPQANVDSGASPGGELRDETLPGSDWPGPALPDEVESVTENGDQTTGRRLLVVLRTDGGKAKTSVLLQRDWLAEGDLPFVFSPLLLFLVQNKSCVRGNVHVRGLLFIFP